MLRRLTEKKPTADELLDGGRKPAPSGGHASLSRTVGGKFAAIVALSGVGAVTRSTLGEILASPPTQRLFRQVLSEGYAVGTAHGAKGEEEEAFQPATSPGSAFIGAGGSLQRVARSNLALTGLDDAKLEKMLAYLHTLPGSGTASLQRDLMQGKVSELHAQIGAMVTAAEAKGVSAPAVNFIFAALLPQERAAEERAAGGAKAGVSNGTGLGPWLRSSRLMAAVGGAAAALAVVAALTRRGSK